MNKTSRIILHLHPQGAHLARSIDYIKSSFETSELIPILFPTFLDEMNQRFRDKLLDDLPKRFNIPSTNEKHSLNLEYINSFPVDPADIKKVIEYILPYKPELYDYFKRLSVEDTLSRNLLWNSQHYFESDPKVRLDIEGEFGLLHDILFFRTLKIILAIQPKLFIISHINYIYYTAPLMACHSLGVPILLLHGGYKETILLKEITKPMYSPACVRNDIFNHNINSLEGLYTESGYSRSYEYLPSISELSDTIKSQQSMHFDFSKKRLVIVNHQVISEIAHSFSATCRSSLMQNRFTTLKNLLIVLLGKENIDVYLRVHPDSQRYPGEINLVRAICEEVCMPEDRILLNHDDKKLESIIYSAKTFPEILNLGGNSTNELLSNGVISYSIGKCYLPSSCNSYILETLDSLHHYLTYPKIYCSRFPTDDERAQCRLFLNCFRRSMIRSSKVEKQLDECDNYFHFGNPDREQLSAQTFLEKSSNLNIIQSMSRVESNDKSQVINLL